MPRQVAIEVEINEDGKVHRIDKAIKLPKGRALLILPDSIGHYPVLMSGNAFEDWLRPEEDEAWAYLQSDHDADSSSI